MLLRKFSRSQQENFVSDVKQASLPQAETDRKDWTEDIAMA